MDSQPEASKRTARKRSSTESSYYDFHGTPCNESTSGGQDWMYAWEARAQVLRAPGRVQNPYPSFFHNHPIEGYVLPLQVPAPVLHHPLIPGRKTAWDRRGNVPPGVIRAFYNQNNRRDFDVGYHDPGTRTSGRGFDNFAIATYVPRSSLRHPQETFNPRNPLPAASLEPSPSSSQESTPDDSDSSDDLPDLIPADPYSFPDLPDWDRQSGKDSLRQHEPQMNWRTLPRNAAEGTRGVRATAHITAEAPTVLEDQRGVLQPDDARQPQIYCAQEDKKG
ncbi:hypothetical protein M434DRAFT_16578 [Hypoxylon sp. CO27-5]|nr:hypothetical protein M434DRAFT_16578 [Hypoxylon sp. CO27-5]